jgi:hypothetical protein
VAAPLTAPATSTLVSLPSPPFPVAALRRRRRASSAPLRRRRTQRSGRRWRCWSGRLRRRRSDGGRRQRSAGACGSGTNSTAASAPATDSALVVAGSACPSGARLRCSKCETRRTAVRVEFCGVTCASSIDSCLDRCIRVKSITGMHRQHPLRLNQSSLLMRTRDMIRFATPAAIYLGRRGTSIEFRALRV